MWSAPINIGEVNYNGVEKSVNACLSISLIGRLKALNAIMVHCIEASNSLDKMIITSNVIHLSRIGLRFPLHFGQITQSNQYELERNCLL